jgi:hypothetical protein
LLLLTAVFLVHLRRRRNARRAKVAGFVAFAALYVSVLYGWLFWRTFFELRADATRGTLELVMRAPERRVTWPLAEIASISAMPTYKLGYHLVVETADGRLYESPRLDVDEVTTALDALRPLGKEP